jgi:hypothetical protein
MTMAVHTECDLMLFSLGWEFPDHQAREFTKTVCKRPLVERLSRVMGARFPCFAPISYVSPQKSSNIHAIY